MDDVPFIEGDQTWHLKVGSKLTEGLKRRLIDFLRSNSDCFACFHANMPGIDPEIIMHKLQVDPEKRGGNFLPKGMQSSTTKSKVFSTQGSFARCSIRSG